MSQNTNDLKEFHYPEILAEASLHPLYFQRTSNWKPFCMWGYIFICNLNFAIFYPLVCEDTERYVPYFAKLPYKCIEKTISPGNTRGVSASKNFENTTGSNLKNLRYREIEMGSHIQRERRLQLFGVIQYLLWRLEVY